MNATGAAHITFADLAAMLPLLVLTAASVVVMLTIALRRDHRLIALLTGVSLLLALMSLPLAGDHAPRQITSLLVIDGYALFLIALLLATGIGVTALSYVYYQRRAGLNEELYVLLLIALLGAAVLVSSSHFASLFLGLELLSVSLFALVPYTLIGKTRLPVEAGAKYLVLAGVASAVLLFGMALIYADIGALSFTDIGMRIADETYVTSPYLLIGAALIIAGLAFKLSLVPFHMWTPDVYQGAPAPVTAFLATVSKGAVFALLIRWFLHLELYRFSSVLAVLGVLALLSMIVGNLLALWQANVKRVLAYSSIAHMGYLLVALIATSGLGVEAAVYYLVAYIIMTLGAFAVVTLMSLPDGAERDHIDDYRGLFWRRPWLAASFTTMLLSLAGIPLTVGFIGKFYIVAAGLDAALWVLLAAVIVGSIIGLFYYLRLIVVMYSSQDDSIGAHAAVRSLPGQLVIVALTSLVLLLGLFPAALIDGIRATLMQQADGSVSLVVPAPHPAAPHALARRGSAPAPP